MILIRNYAAETVQHRWWCIMKKFKSGAYIDVPSRSYIFDNCTVIDNEGNKLMDCKISFEIEDVDNYNILELIKNSPIEATFTFEDHSHFERGRSIRYTDKLRKMMLS